MSKLNSKSRYSIVILLLVLMVVISAVIVLFLKNPLIKSNNKPKVDYQAILGDKDRCVIERKRLIEMNEIKANLFEVNYSENESIPKNSLIKKYNNNFYLINKKEMTLIDNSEIYFFSFLCE